MGNFFFVQGILVHFRPLGTLWHVLWT